MSELIVIGYDSAAQAQAAREDLQTLSKEYLLQLGDAVIATRDDAGRVKLDQMVSLWTVGAAGGSFWGLLAGVLFFNPLLGLVTGAAAGAVAGALGDFGIDDNFMRQVAQVLQPGQAALFVMADKVTTERVLERLASHGGRVLRTNLDRSQEGKLREAFHEAVQTHPDMPAPAGTSEGEGATQG